MNHLYRQPIRVRHVTKRRLLQVARVEQISPRMRRIVLTGEALAGFESAAADDHVKLIVPEPGQDRPVMPVMPGEGGGGPGPTMRDYTPRHYDPARGELTIEFVIHDHGPASAWAAQAAPGQFVGIAGPRGSTLIAEDYAAYLLVGDETALPAIARRLEEARPGTRVHVLIEVADAAEERPLATQAEARITWVHRHGAAPGTGTALVDALDAVLPAERDVHAWIACEIETARRLRSRLVDGHGLDRVQIKAAGYWRIGEADSAEKIED